MIFGHKNIHDLGGIFKKYFESGKYALVFGVKPSLL
jgi:hypothetical protein